MGYSLKLANPLPYYHENHRPQHFLSFAQMENGGGAKGGAGEADADIENYFE